MTSPEEVTDNTKRAFEAVSTATIATALFRRGLRNTVLHGLYSLSPVNKKMVGAAFTVRYIPAREDIDTLDAFEDYQHPNVRRSSKRLRARFSSPTAAGTITLSSRRYPPDATAGAWSSRVRDGRVSEGLGSGRHPAFARIRTEPICHD